jgi:hypothetical protein
MEKAKGEEKEEIRSRSITSLTKGEFGGMTPTFHHPVITFVEVRPLSNTVVHYTYCMRTMSKVKDDGFHIHIIISCMYIILQHKYNFPPIDYYTLRVLKYSTQ